MFPRCGLEDSTIASCAVYHYTADSLSDARHVAAASIQLRGTISALFWKRDVVGATPARLAQQAIGLTQIYTLQASLYSPHDSAIEEEGLSNPIIL